MVKRRGQRLGSSGGVIKWIEYSHSQGAGSSEDDSKGVGHQGTVGVGHQGREWGHQVTGWGHQGRGWVISKSERHLM